MFKVLRNEIYKIPVRIMDAAITMSGNKLNDAEDGVSLKKYRRNIEKSHRNKTWLTLEF